MSTPDDDLRERAEAMRSRAYAPYSNYLVGCALRADGQIYVGCNVENVSYSACICAERSAITAAIAGGAKHIQEVAVASQSSPPAAPCGVCLQMLTEFASDPSKVRILLANQSGERDETTLAALLPRGFNRVSFASGTS